MDTSSKDLPVKHHLPIVAWGLLQSGEAVWCGDKPGSAPAVQLKKKATWSRPWIRSVRVTVLTKPARALCPRRYRFYGIQGLRGRSAQGRLHRRGQRHHCLHYRRHRPGLLWRDSVIYRGKGPAGAPSRSA